MLREHGEVSVYGDALQERDADGLHVVARAQRRRQPLARARAQRTHVPVHQVQARQLAT